MGRKPTATPSNFDSKHKKDNHSSPRRKHKKTPKYGDLMCRCSLQILVDALKELNPKQMRAVSDMGFGSLIHIGITRIIGKLAYYLVSNFDAVSCSLILPNSRKLHICDEDVWVTLGIPRGHLALERKAKKSESPLFDEWASFIGKPKSGILASDVAVAMKKDVDGGEWFKRNFLILVECCLFESSGDGYVRPKIMDNLYDLWKVKYYNWCDYMISVLIRSHETWKKNTKAKFLGPILFLIGFYVDRVVLYRRPVERCFPTIKGWDCDILRVRQRNEMDSGGFGWGHVDERLVVNNPCCSVVEEEMSEGESYTEKLYTRMRRTVDAMGSLIGLVNDAPVHLHHNKYFQITIEMLRRLIGVSPPSTSSMLRHALLDDKCNNPKWNACVVKMLEVLEMKNEMNSRIRSQHTQANIQIDGNDPSEVDVFECQSATGENLDDNIAEAIDGANVEVVRDDALCIIDTNKMSLAMHEDGPLPIQKEQTNLTLQVEDTICLQCGDRGFENAFVYCVRCLSFAVHRYCLNEVPETFDEVVHWRCDDCEVIVEKQSAVPKLDAIPSQTIHHEVLENRLLLAEGIEHVCKDGSELAYDACAKFDLIECGEAANHVQLDRKNDENAIHLPADLQVEREMIDRDLIEPIGLLAGCLKPKKRRKKEMGNVIESTTQKDQHRDTTSCNEVVKVDVNGCARLESGLIKLSARLPEQKRTDIKKKKKGKRKNNILGPNIEKKHILDTTSHNEHVKADTEGTRLRSEPTELSSGSVEQKKTDIKHKKNRKRKSSTLGATTEKDQHSVSTSHNEHVKVDIECTKLQNELIVLSSGSVEQKKTDTKTKKNRKRDSSILGPTTEKDQQNVSAPSHNEHVEVDIECTRLESEPIELSSACVEQNKTEIKKKSKSKSKKRKNSILVPTTEKDQKSVSASSHHEHVKVDIECTTMESETNALSSACVEQKKTNIKNKKNRDRKSNTWEPNTEKDQQRPDASSHSEQLKVDKECTRLESEPIELLSGCMEQKKIGIENKKRSKKRKSDITGPTIDKDQQRVSISTHNEPMTLDIECARVEGELIELSSGCVEQKKIGIKNKKGSKKRKSDITGPTIDKDHQRVYTPSHNELVTVDIECARVEGEPIELSSGCVEQKKTEIKNKRRRSILEPTSEKDEQRVSTSSHNEYMKVDIKCTRLESDPIVWSSCSVEQKKMDIKNKKKRKILGPTTEDQHGLATACHNEHVKVNTECTKWESEPIDLSAGCLKQKETEIKNWKRKSNTLGPAVEKDKQRLATTSHKEHSIVDMESTRLECEPIELPSDCLEQTKTEIKKKKKKKKRKSITMDTKKDQPRFASSYNECEKGSEIFESKDQNCISDPFGTAGDLGITGVPSEKDLGTVQKDLGSSNNLIENRVPEEKEELASICQSRYADNYYPEDLALYVAEPIVTPIWRGSFNISNKEYGNIDDLLAHISNKACHKVYKAVSQIQPVLHLKMFPKSDIWPKSFVTAEPSGDSIALYFFPSKISEQAFDQLVSEMMEKELGFKACVQNVELLIFTSTELPLRYWRFRNKYYLWGVFKAAQASPLKSLSSNGVKEVPLIRENDNRSAVSPPSISATTDLGTL